MLILKEIKKHISCYMLELTKFIEADIQSGYGRDLTDRDYRFNQNRFIGTYVIYNIL